MKNKHIMIVDDHALFRTGLKMILMQIGEAASISEASSIKEAFNFCDSGVDVVLLDIHMPGLNGIDGIKPIHDKFSCVPIIILSASDELSDMQNAKQMGAAGFMNKATLAEDIVASISRVLNGDTCFPDDVKSTSNAENSNIGSALTARQMEVLMYLSEGKSNKLIARELDMSENTVRVHVSAILATLGAVNRSEAIVIAQREGITC
jgi:DNA-binding NarL/FixJ family response regulator